MSDTLDQAGHSEASARSNGAGAQPERQGKATGSGTSRNTEKAEMRKTAAGAEERQTTATERPAVVASSDSRKQAPPSVAPETAKTEPRKVAVDPPRRDQRDAAPANAAAAARADSHANAASRHVPDEDTFTESAPDDFTAQVCLVVEEKRVYLSKSIAVAASPFLKRRVLEEPGGTLHEVTIELSDAKYVNVVEMLRCIHPAHMKGVDVSNVFYLLPLAERFEMAALKRRCEKLLYHHVDDASTASPEGVLSPGSVVYYLYLSTQYDLKWLLQKCLYLAGKLKLERLEATKYYNKLPQDVQMNLQRLRIHYLEDKNQHTQYDEFYRPPPTEIDNRLSY